MRVVNMSKDSHIGGTWRSAMPLVYALAAFLLVTFVWPLVRHRRRTGEWGLVSHRDAEPCQKLIGVLMAFNFVAVVSWVGTLSWVDPISLGVRVRVPLLGWSLIGAGLILIVLAQRQMGLSWRIGIDSRRTSLITEGVFAVVRNPIFSGMLLALAGVVSM